MATDHPLFLYRYMERAAPRGDSPRFRVRISAAFPNINKVRSNVYDSLRAEAGITPPSGQWGVLWEQFFTKSPMDEVLTAITITFQNLKGYPIASAFLSAVERALADENMGFRIDAGGAIHYAVDEVFEGERAALLAVLNAPPLAAANRAYESVYRHMGSQPPDTLAAVRAMFDSVEIVARQLCPAHQNLHVGLCRGELRDRCLQVLGGDEIEQKVWAGMFAGLVEWVSAMHIIRHGQPRNTAPLTEGFAIFAISSGSAYLRMLCNAAVQVGVQPVAE
ncbi:MAG: hypothetical protein Q7T13_05920 [Polaromonas sp.]|nr:hypothetical protein [Polaromonas sp.]